MKRGDMKTYYFNDLDEYIDAMRNRKEDELILIKKGAEFASDMQKELRNGPSSMSILEAAEIVQRKRFEFAQYRIKQEQIIQGIIYNPGLW